MRRLRRRLGEGVPVELVFPPSVEEEDGEEGEGEEEEDGRRDGGGGASDLPPDLRDILREAGHAPSSPPNRDPHHTHNHTHDTNTNTNTNADPDPEFVSVTTYAVDGSWEKLDFDFDLNAQVAMFGFGTKPPPFTSACRLPTIMEASGEDGVGAGAGFVGGSEEGREGEEERETRARGARRVSSSSSLFVGDEETWRARRSAIYAV